MNVNSLDLAYVMPELVVAIGAVLVLVMDLALPPAVRRWLGRTALGIVVLAFVAAVATWGDAGGAPRLFVGTLVRDYYSLAFDMVFLISAFLGILLSLRYVERHELHAGEFYALTLTALLGMMLMAASVELVTLFISYEILSLSVYVLTGIARGRERAAEAAMKYFLLGAFSSGFLIYGIALVYGASGTTSFDALRLQTTLTGNSLLLTGLALITIGFSFKVAAVPFHAWVPDVYEGAPLPVTAFMAAGVKAAAYAAFARVLFSAFGILSGVWQPAVWVLAILTMVMGNTAAIPQTNIKRMLAYSSIAHAGYILVALASYSSGAMAISGVIYYTLVYAAMTVGAFAVTVMVGREAEENQDLTAYQGLAARHPWLAAAMALFMISLAGLPPTAGFLGKFVILNAALQAGQTGLAVVLVLTSVISWYYYLRIVWFMYFERTKEDTGEPSQAASLGAAVLIAAALVVFLGVAPTIVLHATHTAATALVGTAGPLMGGL